MIIKDKEWNEANKKLEGQRIKQINIDESAGCLYITTDKAIHKFHVESDCCSYSYFYEINNINQMLTWISKDIEEIDMPEVPEQDEYTCTLAYGYKINTEGGYGLIVFRNDSNGYYGGWMKYVGTVDEAQGKELKEDWNA